MSEVIVNNLLSPAVLFFLLGVFAALVKSDLKFPSGLSEGLSIFLLIAIGLKGGIELSKYSIDAIIRPMMATLLLGVSIPILVLLILRFLKLDIKNSVGLAATYGSVSIVTYGAAIAFLDQTGTAYEGLMNAMVVLMESPAILVSLLVLSLVTKKGITITSSNARGIGITPTSSQFFDSEVIRESLFGKSIMLLLGSLIVGLVVGERGLPTIKPLFLDLYGSVLVLFLLNMGLIAGKRLPEVKKQGIGLLMFALLTPLFLGTIGVVVGNIAGLSIGGSMLMGVLAGSASYIAAPAALKSSVPEANPSIYLGLALGVTFPLNLTMGIPFYLKIAQWLG